MAITYSITPPTSLQSGTNKTNVVNIPNDYFLNVPTGEINVVSGDNTTIDAGADAEVIANDNITVEATGGIVSIESKSSEVTVDAASDITLDAGATVLAKAATSVTIDTPETFIKNNTTLGEDEDVNAPGVGATTTFRSKINSDLIPVVIGAVSTATLGNDTNRWATVFTEDIKIYSDNNVGNPYLEFGDWGRPYDPTDIYDTVEHRTTDKDGNPVALYVAGGVGIEQDLNVGGRIYGRIEIANTSFQLVVTSTNADLVFHPLFALNSGEQFVYVDNTGTLSGGLTYNPFTGKLGTDLIRVYNTATATATTGSIRVDGGISVGENIVTKEVTPPEDAETATEVYGLGTTSSQWAEAYVHDLYTKVIASTDNSNIEIKVGK